MCHFGKLLFGADDAADKIVRVDNKIAEYCDRVEHQKEHREPAVSVIYRSAV